MKILIDTHILVWYLSQPQKLKKESLTILNDKFNVIYFSSISLAEMAITASQNNIDYPENLLIILENIGFSELVFRSIHSYHLKTLPFHHKDPFDRMIISQALTENLKVISYDNAFKLYTIDLL